MLPDVTGEFAGLSGTGTWSGEDTGNTGTDTMSGEIAFGDAEAAVPVATFDRLNDRLGECFDGYTATDGLSETATVGDTMLRISFLTGEITEHGAPPVNCAHWLGDETSGRAIANNQNGEPLAATFGTGRQFSANANSPDGAFVAIGSASSTGSDAVGRVFVLHTESGELAFQLDTPEPVTSLVF